MDECESAAIQHDLRRQPKSLLSALRGDRLRPGDTVRIWSCETKARSVLQRLHARNATTVPFHLCAEIVPRVRFGAESTSYTIGFGYGADARKPEGAPGHLLSTENGVIYTPDHEFAHRIKSQRNRRHARYVTLEAIGKLNESHIQTLQMIARNSKVSSIRYDIKDGENIVLHMLRCPEFQKYRALTWVCPRTSAYNCASFVETVFPDIVFCRNRLHLADPTACRALAVKDDAFAGCNDRGTLDAYGRQDREISNAISGATVRLRPTFSSATRTVLKHIQKSKR